MSLVYAQFVETHQQFTPVICAGNSSAHDAMTPVMEYVFAVNLEKKCCNTALKQKSQTFILKFFQHDPSNQAHQTV